METLYPLNAMLVVGIACLTISSNIKTLGDAAANMLHTCFNCEGHRSML